MKWHETKRTVSRSGTILVNNHVLRVPDQWAGSRIRVFTNSLGQVHVKHPACHVTVIPFDRGINPRSAPASEDPAAPGGGDFTAA